MQVVERTHHINVNITGDGVEKIVDLLKQTYPDLIEDADDSELWESSDLAREIKAQKTPGKMLRAYRERAGLSVVQLAESLGTKYPNISAMENDRRTIGLNMARKIGKVLNVDFHRFLAG